MSDALSAQIQKWREAHPGLQIGDDALRSAGPWPSLFANDFAVMLEAKGTMSEVVQFVRDMGREMVWAYDNWKKAQRDADPSRLLLDLINNASMPEYDFTRRFLADYAAANNIPLGGQAKAASWEDMLAEMGKPPEANGRGVVT